MDDGKPGQGGRGRKASVVAVAFRRLLHLETKDDRRLAYGLLVTLVILVFWALS